MSFKRCIGCVEPFLTPFIEEDNLKMSAMLQDKILGEDIYCLRLKCKGSVEVLEVEKMVVIGNHPVWSMSRRQMVHCKKCFYHASVLAHKWNSRANPKKQQQRQRLGNNCTSLNLTRYGGCLPPVIPEINVWSMSMEEILEKKEDSWNDQCSVADASVTDFFQNKKEQREAQHKLRQEQFEMKEAIRQQSLKQELQRQLQEQVKKQNWFSQKRGLKQLLLPQQKQESREPQVTEDTRDDDEECDHSDRQDDILEVVRQKPLMTEVSEKSAFSLGRSRQSKNVVLVAVSSQTPEKEIFDSSGRCVARGGKMILRRQPRIPSYTC